MVNKWAAWRIKIGEAGMGPFDLPPMHRGFSYSATLSFGSDFSEDAFTASLHKSPDGAGVSLAVFTVTSPALVSGKTEITLSLTDTQVNTLTADTDGNGFVDFVYDIVRTPSGGSAKPIMAGQISLLGNITDAA
jgi:hypothetical protein